MLRPHFIVEIARALKNRHINIGVDTCGYVPLANLRQVLPYTDFFLWDIKHMDPEVHRKLTGVSNELILNNARFVADQKIPLYIRLPLIKGYNDSEENIRATCEFASGLTSLEEVNLLPLHHLGKARYESLDRPYPLQDVPLIGIGTLQEMERLVKSYRLRCRIVG